MHYRRADGERRPRTKEVIDGRSAAPSMRRVSETKRPARSHARVPLDTKRLRELRESKRWTQHELSLRLGVQGAAAVSAWERGVSVPHPDRLQLIAEVLGVEPSELLLARDRPQGFRELRVARGLSRRALASSSATSVTTVRRWESGDFKSMPDLSLRRSVAAALGVPLSELTRALEVSREAADTD